MFLFEKKMLIYVTSFKVITLFKVKTGSNIATYRQAWTQTLFVVQNTI